MKRGNRAFFEKLPIQVIAFQWFGHNLHEPENDLVRYFRRPDISGDKKCNECNEKFHDHGWIDIKEDGYKVCPNDWIIKDIVGEFYPCKPSIFKDTYKKVKQ